MKNAIIAVLVIFLAIVGVAWGYGYLDAAQSAETVVNPIEVGPVLTEPASAPTSAADIVHLLQQRSATLSKCC